MRVLCFHDRAHHEPECRYLSRRTGARCPRRATRHVNYGTGCATLCGTHANMIVRRKPGAQVVTIGEWRDAMARGLG